MRVPAAYRRWSSVAGTVVKRHSKSIDLQRQGCGRCGGRFEFLGGFKRDGTPMKQRKASGFSLYLKKHFSRVRAQQAQASHGDVMRTISRMWKEEKNGTAADASGAAIAV